MTATTHATSKPTLSRDVSVAVTHPGGRIDKLLDPLATTSLNVAVEPTEPGDYDVILMDQPRSKMVGPLARYRDTPIIYRVRGNLWKEMDIWRFGRLKRYVATNIVYPQLDGAIAVDARLGHIFKSKTGVSNVGVAGLAKDPDNWPTASHDTERLDLISITNFNYRQKVMPLYRELDTINDWLTHNDGHLYVCGDGYNEQQFRERCAQLPNVSFCGYIDPKEYLPDMDAMVHISEFDAYPNVILEAMASNLPVLTNDFAAFNRPQTPNPIYSDDITEQLARLRDPSVRQTLADDGRRYVRENHSYEVIGQQYERFLRHVVERDDDS